MSELEAMGIALRRTYNTSSTSINGIQLGSNEKTVLALTLPAPCKLKATFSKEGLTSKLVKIFKKELQTGDPAFDETVYVKTDTPDQTAALLQSSQLREIVARVVATGGAIEIDGASVSVTLAGRQETEDPDTVKLVRALVG